MQANSRRADQTFLIGNDIEVVLLEVLDRRMRQGTSAPFEIVVLRFELTNEHDGRPKPIENELPAEAAAGLEADLTADVTSNRLLHQFCERRKLLQMLNAIQALCVSALAAVTDGNISF